MKQQDDKRAFIAIGLSLFVFVIGTIVINKFNHPQIGMGILCSSCLGLAIYIINFARSHNWSIDYHLDNENHTQSKTEMTVPSIMVFCPYGCDRLQSIPLNRSDEAPSYYPKEKEHRCNQCRKIFGTPSYLHLTKKEGE